MKLILSQSLKYILSFIFLSNFIYDTNCQTVIQYQKLEVDIDISNLQPAEIALISSKNPFDKQAIYLEILISKPDNSVDEINGFYFEDFTINFDNNYHHPLFPHLPHEFLTSNNSAVWKFRYTPVMVGNYTYTVTFKVPGDPDIELTNGAFSTTTNTNSKKSFIELVDNQYFAHENGAGYNPIGLNIPTYPEWESNCPKSSYYDLLFTRLSENGGNFARIWINWAGSMMLMGFHDNVLYYDEFSQKDSYVLDKVIEYAEEYGIKLQVCLFVANNFSTNPNDPWPTFWEGYNAYSSSLGGPCNEPIEFFSNASAIDNQKNYLSYCINRWGYSTSILSWELFNEVDGIPGINRESPIHQQLLKNWHEQMYNFLKQNDVTERPITTSVLGSDIAAGLEQQIFSVLDYVNIHRYIDTWGEPGQTAKAIWRSSIHSHKTILEKPVLLGEGQSFGEESGFIQYDPNAFNFHSELWSTGLMGCLGPVNYWVGHDFLDRSTTNNLANEYMKQFKAFSSFYNEIPYIGKTTNRITALLPFTQNDNMRVYYIQDNDENKIYGWAQDENFHINNLLDYTNQLVHPYLDDLNQTQQPNHGSVTNSFIIENIPLLGEYKIHWYNTENGNIFKVENVVCTEDNKIRISVPKEMLSSKYLDIAFIIEHIECGWQESEIVPLAENEVVLENVNIVPKNGKLYYARSQDGKVRIATPSVANPNQWTEELIDLNHPNLYHNFEKTKAIEVKDANNIFIINAFSGMVTRLYQNNGWNYQHIGGNINTRARKDSELHFGKYDFLYYVRYDGIIVYQENIGGNWVCNWLNPNAPKAKNNTGFAVVSAWENDIFYVGENSYLHRLYFNNGWQYEQTTPSHNDYKARNDTEVHYSGNTIYYVRAQDGKILEQYKVGNSWETHWLNPFAPEVKVGTGIQVSSDSQKSIYYIGKDDNLYRMYYTYNNGWDYEKFNIEYSESGGAKNNLCYMGGALLYTSMSNSKIFSLKIPCPPTGPNPVIRKNAPISGDFLSSDKVDYIIYPNPGTLYTEVKSFGTEFNQLLLFDLNGKTILTRNFEPTKSYTLNISDVLPGSYVMKISGDSGSSIIRLQKQ